MQSQALPAGERRGPRSPAVEVGHSSPNGKPAALTGCTTLKSNVPGVHLKNPSSRLLLKKPQSSDNLNHRPTPPFTAPASLIQGDGTGFVTAISQPCPLCPQRKPPQNQPSPFPTLPGRHPAPHTPPQCPQPPTLPSSPQSPTLPHSPHRSPVWEEERGRGRRRGEVGVASWPSGGGGMATS